MNKKLTLILAASVALASQGVIAQDGHEGHNHGPGGHHHPAPKASTPTVDLVLKDVCIVKMAHDSKSGKMTLTILDKDKKPLKPAKAPRINLIVDGKRKQVKTTAVATVKEGNAFTAEDAILKGKLKGHVALKIGDKNHKVDLDPHAGHDHGAHGHDHSGHDHSGHGH